jgi:pyruvate dehydrogenase complex dehydrogenase (E1) component
LRAWIDACPNALYSALVFKGGASWRERLAHDLSSVAGVERLLAERDDASLARLMTNLAGHDMPTVLDAFHALTDDRPTCIIAYTIKGLPIAGHKDNHPGLMTEEQVERFRADNGIVPGAEWDRFAGLEVPAVDLERFLTTVPFAATTSRRHRPARVPVPAAMPLPAGERMSTQEGFGRLLVELSYTAGALADRIVTTSPDVTITTNLGGWVNQRDVFFREQRDDVFKAEHVISAQRWAMSPKGQHVELGITENNLFIFLAAPKAIIAGGYWLKPPGPGAELAIVYQGVVAPQAVAVYEQILEDIPDAGLLAVTSADRLNAGWQAAHRARYDGPTEERAAVEELLAPLARNASLVTVIDGHPATLAWLGGVRGHRVQALGVEHFGQSGDVTDLHRVYRIDEDAILDAVAAACLAALASN